jgi:transposase
VAREVNLSVSTVIRIFDLVGYSKPQSLPEVLAIDEFKGNTGNYKYQVAILDGTTHKPIDIVECRYKTYLVDYFKSFPLKERERVKYVVIDLWKAYKDLAQRYFPNAKIVADRFHYARYITEAVDIIRKEVQSKLGKKERKYFNYSI